MIFRKWIPQITSVKGSLPASGSECRKWIPQITSVKVSIPELEVGIEKREVLKMSTGCLGHVVISRFLLWYDSKLDYDGGRGLRLYLLVICHILTFVGFSTHGRTHALTTRVDLRIFPSKLQNHFPLHNCSFIWSISPFENYPKYPVF